MWGRGCLCRLTLRHPFPLRNQPHDSIVQNRVSSEPGEGSSDGSRDRERGVEASHEHVEAGEGTEEREGKEQDQESKRGSSFFKGHISSI